MNPRLQSRQEDSVDTGFERPEDERAVLWFEEIPDDALPRVGGKALNLGVLTGAGMPVPPGFCVTTAAYERASRAADVGELLDELDGLDPADVTRMEEIAAALRTAIVDVPIPPGVAEDVVHAYETLSAGEPAAVAVRSSATAEDLPFASFAGQQDTYLNIIGTEEVLDAVHRCWASLWADRAVAYRTQNQISHREVRLAVVVQRMVEARVAGVMLTANALTGRRRQASIDASPGLGESVVSGAVNPDQFTVDTTTGEILSRHVGDKRVVIRAVAGGGTEHIEVVDGAEEACLTDEQVMELARLGRRVEDLYGSPQDTEWAIDDERIWLTQARPITTLFPVPEDAPEPEADPRVYFSLNVHQGVYQPLTPMGLATVRVIASSVADFFGITPSDILAGPPAYKETGQRMFLDVTSMLRDPLGQRALLGFLGFSEARSGTVMRHLADDPRLSIVPKSRAALVRRSLRLARRTRMPLHLMRGMISPDRAWQRLGRVHERMRAPFEEALLRPAAERLDLLERGFFAGTARTMIPAGATAVFGLVALRGGATKLLGDLVTPEEMQTVMRGQPHNPTMKMDLSLWEVARAAREDQASREAFRNLTAEELAAAYADGSLPPALQKGLEGFLREYGYRGIAEIDLGLRRWGDDPAHLLQTLASYLQISNPEQEPDHLFASAKTKAEAMVSELTLRVRRKKGRLRAGLVGFLLGRLRNLASMREIPKDHLVDLLGLARRALLGVGEELAAARRLVAAEDVFFLDTVEARRGLEGADLRPLVRSRRAAYEEELRRRNLPRILMSDGTEPERDLLAAATTDEGVLTGIPASFGAVTAKARVILNPVGARLEPGEVLVAPSTDPGWTPLFLAASALVMEMGGANSHGAIVAREYGIPAIVGVHGATEQITTGQLITVNGSAGQVVLDPEPADGVSSDDGGAADGGTAEGGSGGVAA